MTKKGKLKGILVCNNLNYIRMTKTLKIQNGTTLTICPKKLVVDEAFQI